MEFSPEQKKIIGRFVKYQLECHKLNQVAVAKLRGCTAESINCAIWQKGPLHMRMQGVKDFVAQQVGRKNWEELCAEALTQEAVGA